MYYLKKYQKLYSEAELRYALRHDYGYLSPEYEKNPWCPDGNGVTTLAVFDKSSEAEREWNAHPEYEKGEMTFDDRGALVTMYFVYDGTNYYALPPSAPADLLYGIYLDGDRILWKSEDCVVRLNDETKRFERHPDGAKYVNERYFELFWGDGGSIEPPIRDDDYYDDCWHAEHDPLVM